MTDLVRVSIQGEEDRLEDPTPVQLLSSLATRGKLGRFTGAVTERRGTWTCICLLEDDLLHCGEEEDWQIVVGTCAELENVPEYVGWGQVSVWLEHGDWVLTLCSPDEQEETGNDIVVWERNEFCEHCATAVIAQAPFARDSSVKLNAALHHIAQP